MAILDILGAPLATFGDLVASNGSEVVGEPGIFDSDGNPLLGFEDYAVTAPQPTGPIDPSRSQARMIGLVLY